MTVRATKRIQRPRAKEEDEAPCEGSKQKIFNVKNWKITAGLIYEAPRPSIIGWCEVPWTLRPRVNLPPLAPPLGSPGDSARAFDLHSSIIKEIS